MPTYPTPAGDLCLRWEQVVDGVVALGELFLSSNSGGEISGINAATIDQLFGWATKVVPDYAPQPPVVQTMLGYLTDSRVNEYYLEMVGKFLGPDPHRVRAAYALLAVLECLAGAEYSASTAAAWERADARDTEIGAGI